MAWGNSVVFLFCPGRGIEVVVCRNSIISYPRHNHVSVSVFGMVLDGCLALLKEDGEEVCRAGKVFVIPPYMVHGIEARGAYTLLSVCVRKDMTAGFGGEIYDILGRLPDFCGISREKAKELADSLCRLWPCPVPWEGHGGADYGRAPVPWEGHGNADYGRAPVPWEGRGNADYGRAPVPWEKHGRADYGKGAVGRMIERLEQHPEEKLGIREMAEAACCSQYHFIRCFRREAGLTPHQFQLQNRVRKAQRLAMDADSLTDVALAAGFCDQSHFIRQFEKYVGLTPSAYQASCLRLEPPGSCL